VSVVVTPDMVPVAGFYKTRWSDPKAPWVAPINRPWVAVRIWFGPPHDPTTGEVMDRSYRWQAIRSGTFVELDWVWPHCARHPISEAEYDALLTDPTDATASTAAPKQSVDLRTIPAILPPGVRR